MRSTVVGLALAALLPLVPTGYAVSAESAAPPYVFKDPLSVPAPRLNLVERASMQAVAVAGTRLVAVGLRGVIAILDEGSSTWRQVSVPVSTDLVAVSFPTAQKGWAVGHDGLVLHTDDGGENWKVQLDWQGAVGAATKRYADSGLEGADRARESLGLLDAGGRGQVFLDVWFRDEQTGYVVGNFGWIFRTADGGASWTPLMERIDNPMDLHLYAIRGDGAGGVFTVGEQGRVWRLDATVDRFVPADTSYTGTLFGLVLAGDDLITFGMRGSVFHSADRGASWTQVAMPGTAGVTAGLSLGGGRIILVSQAGEISLSKDGGRSFGAVEQQARVPIFGAAALGDQKLVIAGPAGLAIETWK